ncbi:MAG: hypothetical protein Q9227_003899 [Pyrenula ochraceoflavens]
MAPIESPFYISPEDVLQLQADESFNALYTRLSRSQTRRVCSSHTHLPSQTKKTYLLHTTILHHILSPLLTLHTTASALATHHLTLHPRRKSTSPPRDSSPATPSPPPSPPSLTPTDLELAFRGPSRSAFSWLTTLTLSQTDHAFLTTTGCPVCVTQHTLSAEPYLRALIAGTRLSNFFSSSVLPKFSTNPTTAERTTADLTFFLPVLQAAIIHDDFWGADYWREISSRAADFESGVRDLVRECRAMSKQYPEVIISPQPSRPKANPRSLSVSFTPASTRSRRSGSNPSTSSPVTVSVMKRGASKRQRLPQPSTAAVRVRIAGEPPITKNTQEWVGRMVKSIFGSAASVEDKERDGEKGGDMGPLSRKRSLTT